MSDVLPSHNGFMTLLSLKSPHQRFQAISVLVWLADRDEQEAWRVQPMAGSKPDMIWVTEVALDDTNMLEDPSRQIGWALVEGPEIVRLRELGEVLIPLFKVATWLPTGTEFLDDPAWPEVVRRARRALTAMIDAGWFNLENQNPT